VETNPVKTAKELKKYDLIIIAKPTQAFSDSEKQVLDQYVVHGGKSIWLLDHVSMEMDSLMTTGENLAFPRDLNVNDLFFKYGIRIKPDLVKDLLATPIALATGDQGNATQYTQYPWLFSPMVYPVLAKENEKLNPIISNLDAIKFEFTNPIELLKNDIKKTVLLQSSPYSKAVGTPLPINLSMVEERPEQKEFSNQGNVPLAVLLEGKFNSVYQNRITPFKDPEYSAIGKNTAMIVVSDGDIIKNQMDKNGAPLELGYDKWTNYMYANKEFLLNCINYLLDDNGLINIRNKEVHVPILDKEKVYANYTTTQIITVGVPMLLLLVFGIAFTYIRKSKYTK
jgi:gliding-associated putative ABC transporter substrate-binding component GldG